MRTWKMIIDQTDKYAAFRAYCSTNTADSKCMYNTANFYIRNTMTGLKKSPEKRTHLETEVLHDVFTGLQKANEAISAKNLKLIKKNKFALVGGMNCAVLAYTYACDHFQYPTKDKWFLTYEMLDAIFKHTDNPVYRRMNSQVNQNAIRRLAKAWKGYFKSKSDHAKNPRKYKAVPKIPGYLRGKELTAWFSSQVAKIEESNGKYYLHFVNYPEPFCIGKCSLYSGMKYIKTEIKPVNGGYCLLVTFDDGVKAVPAPKNPFRILGIDPGVNNFAAVGNNFGAVPFIIRGGALKAANQLFNKKRAKLMSALTSGCDSKHSEKYSRQLNTISRKRNDFIRDFFYKCAWYICRYAVAGGVEVIVMGHNEGQKQEVSMGKQSNQKFVSIPYTKFINALKATAAKCGIAVVVREESYTSKASLIDMDKIPTYKEGVKKVYKFSGSRTERGLYRTKDGTELNADINGACNIIRKEFPAAFDGVEDFSYLYTTTLSIGYKDLYSNAVSAHGNPSGDRYHKEGIGSSVRHRDRKQARTEYRKLWGGSKYVHMADKKKEAADKGQTAA